MSAATRRQYVAAYRAANGNVIAIGTPNTIRKYAEDDAAAMRSAEDRAPVFVAYRDLPEWQPYIRGIYTLCQHCGRAIERRTGWNGDPFWWHCADQRYADPPHTPEPKKPLIDHMIPIPQVSEELS